jgi:hypothetical protein
METKGKSKQDAREYLGVVSNLTDLSCTETLEVDDLLSNKSKSMVHGMVVNVTALRWPR